MSPLIFSIAVALVFALVVVSFVMEFVGGWLVLHKAGEHPIFMLVPVYNMKKLFEISGAEGLFVPWLVCAAVALGCWLSPWPVLTAWWWGPALAAYLIYVRSAIMLAQCFGLGAGWQLFSAVLPPFAMCVIGASYALYEPREVRLAEKEREREKRRAQKASKKKATS